MLQTFNLSHINFGHHNIFIFQLFRSQFWNNIDIIIIFSSNKNKNCAFIWNLCENSNRMIYNKADKIWHVIIMPRVSSELIKLVFLNSVWINDNKSTETKWFEYNFKYIIFWRSTTFNNLINAEEQILMKKKTMPKCCQ